ncbi:MAG: hypothetical protein DMG80_17505 [Acidobacteria bacterium]|nr:MAG: hypothetical protein DMG80_17505 [Acidobacteriota bacterium]
MGATQGKNDYSDVAYGGPRPPSGEDRYFFKAYALDTVLPLSLGSQRRRPRARDERSGY